MGVEPKIVVSQNGWFISWKTLLNIGWFGGQIPLFLVQHPYDSYKTSFQALRFFFGKLGEPGLISTRKCGRSLCDLPSFGWVSYSPENEGETTWRMVQKGSLHRKKRQNTHFCGFQMLTFLSVYHWTIARGEEESGNRSSWKIDRIQWGDSPY